MQLNPAPRRKQDIAGIYYLTLPQQGLLHHVGENGELADDPYFSQDVLLIEGELDVIAFAAAWSDVVARHPMLRTDFRWEDVPTPLQIVFQPRPAQIAPLDWRDEPDVDAALARHLAAARRQGFDFAHAADQQLTLARVGETRWLFIWAYHHVAVDGWSFAVTLRDMLACYHLRLKETAPALPPTRSFRDYVSWLERQDVVAAEAFWRAALADFDAPTPLPLPSPAVPPASRWAEFGLPLEHGNRLAAFARRERVTLNTVCQGLWALLLGRLSGFRSVTFGVTVSGRPADLAGAEDSVGLFINTLPLTVTLTGGQTVGDWLRALQTHNGRLREFDFLPLARIQALSSGGGRSLFESLLVFENFPVDAALTEQTGPLRVAPYPPITNDYAPRATAGRNNYPLTLVFVPGEIPRLVFAYDRQCLDEAAVLALAAQARTLLSAMLAGADQPLDALPLVTASQAAALHAAGEGEAAAPFAPMPQQVRHWARSQPDGVAVHGEDGELTFAQLETRAACLARILVAHGVRPETRVALVAERSVAYVTGMLAILKAGGAFLPLDPAQPVARLAALAADADVALLLAQNSELARAIGGARPVLSIDGASSANDSSDFVLPETWQPGQAAYVIYTSGSTGKPKGVVLTHQGLAQYTAGALARLKPAQGARFAMVSTVAADLGHTMLFGALAAGCPLYMAPAALVFDPDGFADYLRIHAIDVVKIVPSHLAGLLTAAEPALPRQTLVLGGETSTASLLARSRELAPGLRILNHYGPTETTVGVLTDESGKNDIQLSLGRPLPGCRARVLDAALQPAPVGMPGELYIGGGSLARGYLGQPGLTAERFVPDPLLSGERLYRTGDRVFWNADGTLGFLGRLDDQVKIRGYRVEPNEIAAVLRTLPGVADAAVVAREGRLLAYVTPDSLHPQTVLAELARQLPEYLVPAALMPLAFLPVTLNGKLDRRALPDPAMETAPAGELPRNPLEATLADIWAAVLGRPSVGIHDNFFELGGDSILNLQIIARARQQGIRLTPKQVFEHKTIAKLAEVTAAVLSDRPQQAVAVASSSSADLPLTPIQHWFFATGQPEPNHWNQSVLLQVERRLDVERLETALQYLVGRHAALRLRFSHDGQRWRQRIARQGTYRLVERIDLAACLPAQRAAEVERAGKCVQGGLSLQNGPMLRAAYCDFGTTQPARLLFAAHHLVIDSVSWRIVLDELQTVYEQLEAGQKPSLPAIASSFTNWLDTLAHYAQAAAAQFDLWRAMDDAAAVTGSPAQANTYGQAARHQATLPLAVGKQLLTHASAAYRCRIEDLLLTALAQAFCRWQGRDCVTVELEGHGREPLFDDIDLSQTVGWFTCRYPVRLAPGASGAEAAIKAVKEQLRRVPDKGIGYGVLRYLSPDHKIRDALAMQPAPLVTFNYLGQIGAGMSSGWLRLVDEPAGASRSPRNRRTHLLDVDACIIGDELKLDWTYLPAMHDAADIETLANDFLMALQALVEHCCRQTQTWGTPSDFPLARLGQPELDKVLAQFPLADDIYPLAPLQAGMLYHSLAQEKRSMYINQLHCEIRSALDAPKFQQAWRDIVALYDILRTAFVWDSVGEPHQVVLREAGLPLRQLDWRHRSSADAGRAVAEFLDADIEQGFDSGGAPLMRLTLIHTADCCHLVWTRHHLLLDGWCTAALLKQILERYSALVRGESGGLPSVRPYRDYIAWLQKRDVAADENFWREQLAGLEEPSLLQVNVPAVTSRQSGYGRVVAGLSSASGERLNRLARQHHVTLNTLLQAAWASLLSRYCGRRDVVFGITVAGRPPELSGVEAMMGLFINTAPLRVRVPAEMPLAVWWQDLQRQNIELSGHEHAQLADVQMLSGIAGNTPLFDTLLVFENYPVDRSGLQTFRDTLEIANVEARETGSFPLTLIVCQGDALTFELCYRRECFDTETIAGLAEHLTRIVEAFAADPMQPAAAVGLSSEAERKRYIGQMNAQVQAYAAHDTLVSWFERQVAAAPDAVAVSHEGDSISYGELNHRANRLAHYLSRRGVRPEAPVALYFERSLELVVAILGVLKAGGCYVPLDPLAPSARLRQIVRDCGAWLLLMHGAGAAPVNDLNAEDLAIEDIAVLPDGKPADDCNPSLQAKPHHLAYIVYTSGSTGMPKGVPISHANVTRLFAATRQHFHFGSGDVWTLFHSYAFDFSVWEMWGALLHGGKLVVVPHDVARDQQALIDLLRREQVTVLNQTPSAFYRLTEAALAISEINWTLRYVIFGGEALDLARLAGWFDRFGDARPQLVNMYGITETTVHVTYRPLSSADIASRSLVGQALPDLRLYVLDGAMQPLPAGVVGELYVGGAGLARGYLNQPELTAERFVPDPFGASLGQRLYRSGDLGRLTANGDVEYIGRIDHQVKIRGYRIELGEIEACLHSHSEVRDVAVLVRDDGHGGRQLVAYVAGNDGLIESDALRRFAKSMLPDYMVPAVVVPVTLLPLTANGKLDRKALSAIEPMRTDDRQEAPRNPVESALAAIWEDVLQVEHVGIHDDFFALGGHSLLATRAVVRMREATGARLAVADLLVQPTIAQLAALIKPVTETAANSDIAFMTNLLAEFEQETQ